jgi:hypothetical protein
MKKLTLFQPVTVTLVVLVRPTIIILLHLVLGLVSKKLFKEQEVGAVVEVTAGAAVV